MISRCLSLKKSPVIGGYRGYRRGLKTCRSCGVKAVASHGVKNEWPVIASVRDRVGDSRRTHLSRFSQERGGFHGRRRVHPLFVPMTETHDTPRTRPCRAVNEFNDTAHTHTRNPFSLSPFYLFLFLLLHLPGAERIVFKTTSKALAFTGTIRMLL